MELPTLAFSFTQFTFRSNELTADYAVFIEIDRKHWPETATRHGYRRRTTSTLVASVVQRTINFGPMAGALVATRLSHSRLPQRWLCHMSDHTPL